MLQVFQSIIKSCVEKKITPCKIDNEAWIQPWPVRCLTICNYRSQVHFDLIW